MAYNLFWFSGTLVQSGFSKEGDWSYAMASPASRKFGQATAMACWRIGLLYVHQIGGQPILRLRFQIPGLPIKQSTYQAYFLGLWLQSRPDSLHYKSFWCRSGGIVGNGSIIALYYSS